MNHDGLTTATMLLLAAFAVDRVTSAVIFLFFPPKPSQEAQAAAKREWSKKLCYVMVAALLAVIILIASTKVRLLEAMGMLPGSAQEKLVDLALTFLVLVGGAERISSFLKSPTPAISAPAPEPLEVTGTIALVNAQPASQSHTVGK